MPVDKNDVGYRELPETDGELKYVCWCFNHALFYLFILLLIWLFDSFPCLNWSEYSFFLPPLASLRKICKAIAEARSDEERVKAFGPIQEMITFVQFANDECDYGMGYELAIDLFCYGSHVSV